MPKGGFNQILLQDLSFTLSSEADRKAATLAGEVNTLHFLGFSVGVICSSELGQHYINRLKSNYQTTTDTVCAAQLHSL